MIRPAQMSVCAAEVASRLFLDGAAGPPGQEGWGRPPVD
jgi:hypothetical protein